MVETPFTRADTGKSRAKRGNAGRMIGVSNITGTALAGDAHLAQSIADILATPLGSRVMRRDYGSLLFELVDRPINGATLMLMHAATAIALRRWEPRLQLTRVYVLGTPQSGSLTMRIEGRRTDLPAANQLQTLTIPIEVTQRRQMAAVT